MPLIMVNLDEDLNKKIRVYMAKNEISSKELTILSILQNKLKDE